MQCLFQALLIAVLVTPAASAASPDIPFLDPNICPFEFGCNFDYWVAEMNLTVFARRGNTDSVSFTVGAGDTLTFLRGDMMVDDPGVVLVRRSFESFARGDTVLVLSYTGEGDYRVWHNGKLTGAGGFWDSAIDSSEPGLLLKPPAMTWWVVVMDAQGRLGWLALRNIAGDELGIDFSERITMIRARH